MTEERRIPSRRCARALHRAFAGEHPERPLGRCILARNYLTSEQLDRCLEEQKELHSSGQDLRLGHLLIKKGYLTAQQLVEVLEDQERETDSAPTVANGRYRIRRVLGRGGMGTVYEAEDTQLRRSIALKVIREDEASADMVARLHREAAIMAQLRHPNIVGIHEVGMARDSDGRALHYIAMDYVPGRTMADSLADPRIGRAQLLKTLEEVARATDYAHHQGVLHRDLKPANVLVEPGGRVLLTDFGLARAHQFATRLTRSREVFGTPVYMAPEQVEGRLAEIDERTDVYALGVILYEILAGRLPFFGGAAEKIYHSIVYEEPMRPSRIRPDVDRELEIVCLKALEKTRARRYSSAGEFAEDLARVRKGEPIRARPASWIYRVGRRLIRRKVAVAIALVSILGTVGAVVGGLALRRSTQVSAFLERARSAESGGRLEEARREYGWVLRLDAGHVEALAAAARIDAELDRRARAAHAREEALGLLEKARPAVEVATEYLYNPRISYEEVELKLLEAQRLLVEAIEKSPDLAAAHYLLGRTWESLGWWDRAEACWRKSLEADPGLSPARFELGRLLLERAILETFGEEGRPVRSHDLAQEALRQIDRALGEGSGFDGPLQADLAELMSAYLRDDLRLADLARAGREKFGDRRGAEGFHLMSAVTEEHPVHRLEFLNDALRIRPRYAPVLYDRALVHLSQGRYDDALSDLTLILKFHPRFYWAYDARGTVHARRKDFNAAIADHTRALDIQPEFVHSWYKRGRAHAELNRLEDAVRDYTRAIALRPTLVRAWSHRGNAHLRKGESDLAIADGSEAVRLDPKEERAYLVLGAAHLMKKDYAQVLSVLDRALEEGVASGIIYYSRAVARLNLEDRKGAAEDARKALTLELPDRRAVEQLLRDLGETP